MTTIKERARLGLYLHIPYCHSRCHYCDFCSSAGRGDMARYVDTLCRQLAEAAPRGEGYLVDTVYFGGGTPTLLPTPQMEALLAAVRASFLLAPDAEITAECNPATVWGEKLSAWRALGINRLSVGVQSVIPTELQALGRAHSREDAFSTLREARAAGFDNISVDAMYGIPHQTRASFAETLDTLLSFAPEHLSAYCLKIEEGTRFAAWQDRLPLPEEDAVCDMYADACRRLSAAGYEHYEISNFARPGRLSRHNRKYWVGEPYLGFGAAAHSYFEGVRFFAPDDIDAYLGGVFEAGREVIDESAALFEYLMLHLRLREGISYAALKERFGVDFEVVYAPRLAPFVSRGLVVLREGDCSLSEEGMFVSNAILAELL